MPLWGKDRDETFEGTLTDSFVSKKAFVKQTDTFILYVDYTKGDEDELQIQVAMSFHDDGNDPVAEEAIVNNNNGLVTPFVHRFTQTRKLRIAIPISPQENEVEVSVQGLNGTPTGTYKLTWGTNSHKNCV